MLMRFLTIGVDICIAFHTLREKIFKKNILKMICSLFQQEPQIPYRVTMISSAKECVLVATDENINLYTV